MSIFLGSEAVVPFNVVPWRVFIIVKVVAKILFTSYAAPFIMKTASYSRDGSPLVGIKIIN